MPAKQCECQHQPNASEKKQIERFAGLIKDYKNQPGALIPVLQIAQKMIGYLPEEVLIKISKGLRISMAEVYGVATFYSYFTLTPRGKHTIRICLGTACYVRGGKAILDAFKKELGIDVSQTTPDRRFSLEVGRCFGACGMAPVIMVNDDTHQNVKPSKIREILAQYK